jgi:hypothetical protein
MFKALIQLRVEVGAKVEEDEATAILPITPHIV